MNKQVRFLRTFTPISLLMFILIMGVFYKSYVDSSSHKGILLRYYFPITQEINASLFTVISLNEIVKNKKIKLSLLKIKSKRYITEIKASLLEIISISEMINENSEEIPVGLLLDTMKILNDLDISIRTSSHVGEVNSNVVLAPIIYRIEQIASILASRKDNLAKEVLRSEKEYYIYIVLIFLIFIFIFLPLLLYLTKSISRHAISEEKAKDELKKLTEELEHLALYDALTGLANRRLLYERINQQLKLEKREHNFNAILYIDFDTFKQINDNEGHDAGDFVLKLIASRMLSSVRESDTVARLGGDEFIIFLQNVLSKKDVYSVVDKLVNNAKLPIAWQGKELMVSLSIGIFLIDGTYAADSVDGYLKYADKALYHQKLHGRDGYTFYDEL